MQLDFKVAGEVQIFVDALASGHIPASGSGNVVTLVP